ncbi:MAG: transcriptional repressor [Verrucomicrobiota bacterium]
MRVTKEEIVEQVLQSMNNNGLRMTNQRKAIVKAAFHTTEHYTAEELLERARELDTSISRATVYRTLPVLVKTGFLRELDIGKDMMHYDPNYAQHPNHNHIICQDCGKIIEFEDYCLDVRESVISKNMGFRAEAVTLRIEGKCEALASKGNCPRRDGRKTESIES